MWYMGRVLKLSREFFYLTFSEFTFMTSCMYLGRYVMTVTSPQWWPKSAIISAHTGADVSIELHGAGPRFCQEYSIVIRRKMIQGSKFKNSSSLSFFACCRLSFSNTSFLHPKFLDDFQDHCIRTDTSPPSTILQKLRNSRKRFASYRCRNSG